MAGRREKIRRVGIIPEYRGFIPDGLASGDAIDMTVDELEALRLCDLEGLNQEAVAQQMGIARADSLVDSTKVTVREETVTVDLHTTVIGGSDAAPKKLMGVLNYKGVNVKTKVQDLKDK